MNAYSGMSVFSLFRSAIECAIEYWRKRFFYHVERTGCEGIFPWYGITILNDGSVRYEGKAYVYVEGVRRKKIPVSDVSKLIQKLRDEDFLHWEEKTDYCVNYPEVRITANLNGQRKRLVEGCLEPGKVLTLPHELDTISDTKELGRKRSRGTASGAPWVSLISLVNQRNGHDNDQQNERHGNREIPGERSKNQFSPRF
jgi:Domain of unknown function (DUF6438)